MKVRKRLLGVALLTALTIGQTTSMTANSNNPLLQKRSTPHNTVPFDQIKTSDFEDAIREAIKEHNQQIDAITKQRSVPDFENTVVALDRAGEQLTNLYLLLGNLEAAVGDTTLMEVSAKLTPVISEHYTSIMLNEPLFQRVKQVYENRDKFNLSPEDNRLLDETYEGFLISGADLSPADREKFRKLSTELSDLTTRYGQNVNKGMSEPSRRMWLTGDQLKGLPESIVNAAREEAKATLQAEGKPDNGTYLFTVYAPSYGPFMKYQQDRALREQMYRLYNTRNYGGEFDNTQILKDIVNVRMEIAKLMGKKNFAEYQLQHTMAKDPETVMNFLNQLADAYREPMKAELKEVEDFARQTEGPDFNLEAWDYSYWSDKMKNARYAFDDEELKPYFELNNTIKGVFGLAEKLYGYKFKENKNIQVYHPDVRAYEVYGPDGKLMGIFYADFFYRPGKAPGAWMTQFNNEYYDEDGRKELPQISIVCNFSKPVGNEAVLLTPMEVETFLHEFGHSLHGLSADTKYPSLSGTNVYHDYVELFSQFNENYMTQKEFLDGFAKHYKTGKKMPQELIDKFISASQYAAAYLCMRQLNFGFLDMAFYTLESPLRASADIEAFENAAMDPVRTFPAVEGTMMSPAFGHIFSGGYMAGYYGYKWAEMLDADAFAAFKEAGIFDKKTANRFRKMMAAGGTKDPMELYIEFRGKKPTIDALLERDGIKK